MKPKSAKLKIDNVYQELKLTVKINNKSEDKKDGKKRT